MHIRRVQLCICILLIIVLFIFYSYIVLDKDISPKKINIENLTKFNLYSNDLLIQEQDWFISIPKINIERAKIKENIDNDILENYIGHFPSSSIFNGNICLAAHNNGFKNNYFKDLINLEENDEIIYNYLGNLKSYYVKNKYYISENDFNMINIDTYDKITLITCVSGSPELRLCVEAYSGKEKDEKIV